jgi:hypothetical protein
MKRAHLTALVATLAMGTVAVPRLAAQDTSATAGQARRDTSGYTGAGGVDTSRADTSGAADTGKRRQPPPPLRDAPGRVDAKDTAGALGATDTSGMKGRHPDTTYVGDTSPARPPEHAVDSGAAGARSGGDSGSTGRRSADAAGVVQPTTQPGQSTSPSAHPSDSTRSQ